MEVKPGYKQTEVGVIPEDWDLRGLSEVAQVDPENLPAWTDPNYSFNYISLEQVDAGRLLSVAEIVFRTAPSRARRVLRHNDVLMSTVRPNLKAHLHFRSQVPNAICSTGFAVLRAHSGLADPAYIFAHLFAHAVNKQIEQTLAGSNYPAINSRDVRALAIPCPSTVVEQRAIAAALSDVDALLGGLDRLIAKKRDLKQAAMQQLLTGQTRLPGFHGEWEVNTVAELEKQKLVKLSRGQVISKRDIDNTPGDFPIYSSSIHNDGLFGRYGDFMFDEELITWSVDGGGNFFHRPRHKFSVTNVCGFMRVETSRIHYRFFAAELQLLHSRKSFDYQSKAHPSVIRKEYEVQLPALAEQTAIAAVLSDMDAELAALEARRDKTRDLKQAMMQELLTGKTRLL